MFKVGDRVMSNNNDKRYGKGKPPFHGVITNFYNTSTICMVKWDTGTLPEKKADANIKDLYYEEKGMDYDRELKLIKFIDNNILNNVAKFYSLIIRSDLIQSDIEKGKPSNNPVSLNRIMSKHNTNTWMEAYYLENKELKESIKKLEIEYPDYKDFDSLENIFEAAFENYATKVNPMDELSFTDFIKSESVKSRLNDNKANDADEIPF